MLLTVASFADSSICTRAILSANPVESAWMASCFDSCHSRSWRVNTASMAASSSPSSAGGRCSVSRTHSCSWLRVCGCGPGMDAFSGLIDVIGTTHSAISDTRPYLYKGRARSQRAGFAGRSTRSAMPCLGSAVQLPFLCQKPGDGEKMRWRGGGRPHHHVTRGSAFDRVAEIFDGFADFAPAFSECLCDLTRRFVGLALFAQLFVVLQIAGRLFHSTFCLVDLSAHFIFIPHQVPPHSHDGRMKRLQDPCLLGDFTQYRDQPLCFSRQFAPHCVEIVELRVAPPLLECARRIHHTVGIEVGSGALEAVSRATQRLAVAGVERRANSLQMPRGIVDEQPADFGEQLMIAADAREYLARHERRVRRDVRTRGE